MHPIPTKACPVVLRGADTIEILAFRHPLAGLQLVKGSIEPGEPAEAAALRELREEAGIAQATAVAHLGLWDSGLAGQVWSFHLCRAPSPLPAQWTHHTRDDGGHDFQFFWHDLEEPASAEWHGLFHGALDFIRAWRHGPGAGLLPPA